MMIQNNNENLKYLIVGTGGVGGCIAGFLAHAGKDVACIARGAHLQAIRKNGLQMISTLKGNFTVHVPAYSSEEYTDKVDVIFVCVKGYSIHSIAETLRKASRKDTLIVPVLNVYGTGAKIEQLETNAIVLDGCIYIVGFVSATGEITQMGKVFRVVFGERKSGDAPMEKLEKIRDDLQESGIKATVSDDINRDTFIKWSFISAMACTGAYFDVPMREIQKGGEARNVFIGLSQESAQTGRAIGIDLPDDLVEYNLKILDSLTPESTASMQKDLAKGHESEIDGLLFQFIRTAEQAGIKTPVYRKVAQKFI